MAGISGPCGEPLPSAMPNESLTTPTAPDERPWRTEGLFSPHSLTHRLPEGKRPRG